MIESPATTVDTLVIACGNPMRGDDAVGPIVARRVEATLSTDLAATHRFIITHQLLPELALELAQAKRAILIDARLPKNEPVGVVSMMPVSAETCSGCASSCCDNGASGLTHHWTLPRLLAMAQMLFGRAPRACLVSVTADDFDTPDTLSPGMHDAVPVMCEHVLQLLRSDPTH